MFVKLNGENFFNFKKRIIIIVSGALSSNFSKIRKNIEK